MKHLVSLVHEAFKFDYGFKFLDDIKHEKVNMEGRYRDFVTATHKYFELSSSPDRKTRWLDPRGSMHCVECSLPISKEVGKLRYP